MTFSPNLGRWLQPDPKRFGAGDTNFYRDERDNPINSTDPSGLDPKLEHSGNPFPYLNPAAQVIALATGSTIARIGVNELTPRDVKVRVTSGVDFDDRPNWIQLEIVQDGLTDSRFHWLQFVSSTRKDHEGKYVPGRILTSDGRYSRYAEPLVIPTGPWLRGIGPIVVDYGAPGTRKVDTVGDQIFYDLALLC
jgi:hypothetical protein